MKKQVKTILINVDRTVPSDSQPILAWDEQNQCYFMMTRKELMTHYDKQIDEITNAFLEYQRSMNDNFTDLVTMLRGELSSHKEEMEKKFNLFTAETAEISNRMINLIETINKGGQ